MSSGGFLRLSASSSAQFAGSGGRRGHYGDRFIPNRANMNFDLANYLLTTKAEEEEEESKDDGFGVSSPSRGAYKHLLAKALGMDRSRILSFKNKPPEVNQNDRCISPQRRTQQQKRRVPRKPEETITAEPCILDDFSLNLLDWGRQNILSIACGNVVRLWNHTKRSFSKLMAVPRDIGPVTSVSWAPDGRHIAVGLESSCIQLWDSASNRLVRTLGRHHDEDGGITSLAWNDSILTAGSDGMIANYDVRMPHFNLTLRGHQDDVSGLRWSSSGKHLASGGADSLVHIWDLSMASSRRNPNQNQWLHRFESHTSAVRALAWCPFRSNLLATGGGEGDCCIKFWDTATACCLNSVHASSQVCSLLWNENEKELLSSHGRPGNQLTLWRYPSMVKTAKLTGHTSRPLYMSQSPDECTVASASGDGTVRLWRVSHGHKTKTKAETPGPFANFSLIR